MNAKILHHTDFAAVADRLPDGMDAIAWDAIRPNISTLADVVDWWSVVSGEVSAEIAAEDRDYLAEAARVAAAMAWDADPWHALTDALKASSGRKGKALFLPLRQALTGHDHGPDMKALLPLIGQARAIARLEKAAA